MTKLVSPPQVVSDTILICDDEELNRDVLENIFAPDFSIQTAANGQQCLDLLKEGEARFCAILLDVVMPVMDGMTVLENLAGQGLLRRIPVFLITGETDNSVIKRAYDFGVMDVISKPISSWIVQRRVNSVIELFVARKRLAGIVDQQQAEIFYQAKQIQKLNIGMIEALASAIESRSGESGSHVRRIHDITRLFLERSPLGEGFSKDDITHISLASIMHDVGKISVPDAILNKPGRLTLEEFETMKTHTTQGGLLLERIPQMHELPFFQYAYDIARYHHERWDGHGYPDGLRGDEIPIWAQIVSVADVYDALVSPRVYKKPFGHDLAMSMIINGECGVFNPVLVKSFQEMETHIQELYQTMPPRAVM